MAPGEFSTSIFHCLVFQLSFSYTQLLAMQFMIRLFLRPLFKTLYMFFQAQPLEITLSMVSSVGRWIVDPQSTPSCKKIESNPGYIVILP